MVIMVSIMIISVVIIIIIMVREHLSHEVRMRTP